MNTTKDEKSSTPDRAHQPVVADRNQRGVGGLAWALTAGSALLLLLAVVLLALNRELGWRALSPHLFVVPGFAVVGLVLAVRRPGHPIGWLFVAMGLVAAVHGFAFEYAVRALATAPGSLPAAPWLACWAWRCCCCCSPTAGYRRGVGASCHGCWGWPLPASPSGRCCTRW